MPGNQQLQISPPPNRTNVQTKGGGSKAFWTMLKKTALFLMDGFPLPSTLNSSGFNCRSMQNSSIPSDSMKSSLASLYFSKRATILASEYDLDSERTICWLQPLNRNHATYFPNVVDFNCALTTICPIEGPRPFACQASLVLTSQTACCASPSHLVKYQ